MQSSLNDAQSPATRRWHSGFVLMVLLGSSTLGVPEVGMAQGGSNSIPFLACNCISREPASHNIPGALCYNPVLDINEIKKSEYTHDFTSSATGYSWKEAYNGISIQDAHSRHYINRVTLEYLILHNAPDNHITLKFQCRLAKPQI
jgi:hypothetical protein